MCLEDTIYGTTAVKLRADDQIDANDVFRALFNEGKNYLPTANMCKRRHSCRNYLQFAWAQNTAIGCDYSICNRTYDPVAFVVCAYDSRYTAVDGKGGIRRRGSPADEGYNDKGHDDEDDATLDRSTKYIHEATEFTGLKASTKPVTMKMLVLLLAIVQLGQSVEIIGKAIPHLFLTAYTKYRNLINATDLQCVQKWNPALAQRAEELVMQCPHEGTSAAQLKAPATVVELEWTENMYSAEQVFQKLYDQGKNYDQSTGRCNAGQTCSNYFTFAWRRNKEIGCAYAGCSKEQLDLNSTQTVLTVVCVFDTQ
ncbi:unnamed protein product [Soboliphyme baturini]|uniref:SCP domain-containing protein n=1 Tax=Soboliphyme baturini TaxID=241478 RepID=A0A183J5L9_9BILA|nr:unnamed protein product [Soboliphyme baturini]